METVRPPMDMSLLLELCRLWSPQRGGFVFPWGGIYRVTAEDIRRILGVASRGDVCVLTSRSLGEEREAARVLYGGDEPGPHGVPLASIVGGRARLAIQAILTTLVQRVTGSTNYSSVPTGWRRTLEACLGGRRMDWATVIRGSLAAKLGRVTQKSGPGAGILELPYCSILISWLHEYFPATGPAQEAVVDEEMPRMQRWTGVPRGEQARMVARPVWGRRVTALTVADYVADPFGDCAWASDAEEEGRPAGGVAEHAVPIADIPPEVPVAGDEEGSAAGGAPEVAAGDPEAMEDPVGRPTESVEILPEGDMPGREGRRVAAWLKVFFPNIGRHPMLREVELEGLGGPWERAIQARHVISQYDAQSSTMAEWAARMEAMDAQFAGQNSVIETLRETISGLQASLKTQQDLSVAQQSTIATLIGQPRRRVRPRVDGGAGTSQEETSGGGTEPAPPT